MTRSNASPIYPLPKLILGVTNVKRLIIWNIPAHMMLQSMIEQFTEMDVSTNPALRHLTPDQQHATLDGLVHTLTNYQEELRAATDQQRLTESSQAADPSAPVGLDMPSAPPTADVEVPVPDSGSMSLTSSSTSPPSIRCPLPTALPMRTTTDCLLWRRRPYELP